MSVVTVLKRVVGSGLKPYGFEYAGKQTIYRWAFSRERDGVVQYVVFQKYRYDYGLRVIFDTSNLPQDMDELCGLVLSPIAKRYYVFETDKELAEILTLILPLIIEYGIPHLEKKSRIIPLPPISPSEAMYTELAKDTEEKCDRFAQAYGLGSIAFIEALAKLETMLIERKSISYEVNVEFFIDAAAFYGVSLQRIHGGEWYWESRFDPYPIYKMKHIGGHGGVSNYQEDPLYLIVNVWNTPMVPRLRLVGGCRYYQKQYEAQQKEVAGEMTEITDEELNEAREREIFRLRA